MELLSESESEAISYSACSSKSRKFDFFFSSFFSYFLAFCLLSKVKGDAPNIFFFIYILSKTYNKKD